MSCLVNKDGQGIQYELRAMNPSKRLASKRVTATETFLAIAKIVSDRVTVE